jgi:hypothetical protein
VGYELRSCKQYFELKERCLLCDIIKQELAQQVRIVESNDLFLAFCPFASRVPYETWLLPVNHHASFEEDLISHDRQLHFGRFLKSILRRLEEVAPAYHLVLHTSPNMAFKLERAGNWQSLVEDYHWHFEILPILPTKSKSYSLREVYYNSLPPESATREVLDPSALGAGWSDRFENTQTIGDEWLQSRRTALLLVPSTIVPATLNIVLNPAHAAVSGIKIARTHIHRIDSRLIRY